jgi:hypothetical protein
MKLDLKQYVRRILCAGDVDGCESNSPRKHYTAFGTDAQVRPVVAALSRLQRGLNYIMGVAAMYLWLSALLLACSWHSVQLNRIEGASVNVALQE